MTGWIPAALAQHPQFVLWIAVPSKTRPGKTDKMPIDPVSGKAAGHSDPSVRMTAADAGALFSLGVGHGVGFVFTEEDPFFFLDIDSAYGPDGWSQQATDLCAQFAGCFVEVSHSGTGLHIIGSTPPLVHGTRNELQHLELYTKKRFVALTGKHATGDPSVTKDLAPLLAIPGWSKSVVVAEDTEWTDGPVPEWSGPADDLDLVAKILASKPSAASAFGGRMTVQELWEGGFDNHNEQDAALMQHLAFWTGKDCERMERLFGMSGLAVRDKWEYRPDYRRNTVLHAVSLCQQVYSNAPKPAIPEPPPPAAEADRWRSGSQILTPTLQVEYFKGCVYVTDQHRVLVPDGRLLKPDQFRTVYGGYQFAIDASGKTTKSAWEAFAESQTYDWPKVHTTCFRPEAPAGGILMEEGWNVVNTYVPVNTPRKVGDATPFTGLLTKLLPDARDREILTSYLAALVQYPGKKFQWWPVLQGTEGNGKSAIIRAVTAAVGNRYTHIPNVDDMARNGFKFNAWVSGKLFIGIEEIYVPDRRDFLEAFKTTVTNERVQIEGKGVNQIMGDNRANGILCTNHKDGVPTTVDTRRYAILFTAQQSKADKERDGMGGMYFPDLYDWFRGEGKYAGCGLGHGYAVVNEFLRSYDIAAEFNPAGMCQEAPRTSSTAEALRLSLGSVEQEVMEAIETGLSGFAGGWVSSLALDKLLGAKRMDGRLPRNKRGALLEGLGYIVHPGLAGGRTNNPVAIDGGKPRLYIKRGHLASNLQTCNEIVKHYTDCQLGGSSLADIFGMEKGGP